VEIENVALPAVVAVSLAGVSLLRVVVVLPGVVVYLLDTIGASLAEGSPVGGVEIAPGRSFDTSAEIAGEIPADNAIPGHANDELCILLSIWEVLVHEKMEHHYNVPTLSDNSGNDTTILPMNATTNH
jgi:hypothetical protein